MKKSEKKLSTTPSNKKSSKSVKQEVTTSAKPKIYSVIILLALLNILLMIGVVFMLILIKFNTIKDISTGKVDSQTTFSYFLKRPDLLSSAKALTVYDANTQISLLSKNQNLRFSPASTAKVMSALVALEHYKPNTILTVETISNNPDSSKMGLFLGEKISVENLVYGMMLPSGGDAAEVLAEHYPGGQEAFIRRMNTKAKEIGLKNTHFVDPAGYEDDNYSTAQDLARLGAYALKNENLREIVRTKKITVYNSDKNIPHVLSNLNELLDIKNVTGVKTGFTNEAEGVLITSFEHEGKTYVMVVLGSKDRFSDTRLLIEGIINDLKSESVIEN